MMRALGRLWLLISHNWPYKFGALLVAVFVWWFVTVNDSPETQASLFVRINVEGVGSDSVVTGLPEMVEVTIRGPSVLLDRLRPENVEAVIDLANYSGSFEVPINVLIPRGVELMRVAPRDVIGTLERVATRSVSVEVILQEGHSADVRLTAAPEPAEVTVRGLGSTLDLVGRVFAPARAVAGTQTVPVFPVGSAGQPLNGVTIEPDSVTVQIRESAVLTETVLPLVLVPPLVPGFTVSARLDRQAVTLIGPPSIINKLENVSGTVDFSGEQSRPGTFTLPVTPELPAEVRIMERPTATVRLTQPIEPE